MANRRAILWFRQDLRMHDNEALNEALATGSDIIPVYVFDERVFGGQTMFGFNKSSHHRIQFVIESVADLRRSLEALGSRLIVRIGRPENVLFELANEYKTNWVYCNRERTTEEKYVQDTLEKNLWSIGQEIRYTRGKMLYYTSDLPFPITHTPDSFTTFRKEVEKIVPIREPLSIPGLNNTFPNVEILDGDIPVVSDFLKVKDDVETSQKSGIKGGEGEALKNLRQILTVERDATQGSVLYDGSVLEYNSKMSAYLAQGCISPKKFFHDTLLSVNGNRKSSDFLQVFHRLMYRDYLRLMGKKYDALIFAKGGVSGAREDCPKDIPDDFYLWTKGNTGQPFIDAIMHQLKTTGFCSHHARKLSATFLIRELNLHWRWGASWFESQLIDYDACSNWVNWMNLAGYGPDQKEERKVNYDLQSKRLDPAGEFVEKWGG